MNTPIRKLWAKAARPMFAFTVAGALGLTGCATPPREMMSGLWHRMRGNPPAEEVAEAAPPAKKAKPDDSKPNVAEKSKTPGKKLGGTSLEEKSPSVSLGEESSAADESGLQTASNETERPALPPTDEIDSPRYRRLLGKKPVEDPFLAAANNAQLGTASNEIAQTATSKPAPNLQTSGRNGTRPAANPTRRRPADFAQSTTAPRIGGTSPRQAPGAPASEARLDRLEALLQSARETPESQTAPAEPITADLVSSEPAAPVVSDVAFASQDNPFASFDPQAASNAPAAEVTPGLGAPAAPADSILTGANQSGSSPSGSMQLASANSPGDDVKLQADALMCRARIALRRDRYDEAQRLAAAAAVLEREKQIVYGPHEERPSDLVSRLNALHEASPMGAAGGAPAFAASQAPVAEAAPQEAVPMNPFEGQRSVPASSAASGDWAPAVTASNMGVWQSNDTHNRAAGLSSEATGLGGGVSNADFQTAGSNVPADWSHRRVAAQGSNAEGNPFMVAGLNGQSTPGELPPQSFDSPGAGYPATAGSPLGVFPGEVLPPAPTDDDGDLEIVDEAAAASPGVPWTMWLGISIGASGLCGMLLWSRMQQKHYTPHV